MTEVANQAVETVVDFYNQIGVPALEIEIDSSTPQVVDVNPPFCREFTVDTCLQGETIDSVAQRDDLPVEQVPHTPDLDGVELDLIEYHETAYLRKRLWTSKYLLEVYHPAGEKLPHHRHISVLHRVFRHNLRNGINAITGWAKVINDTAESDPQRAKEAAQTVIERSEQLARISDEARRLEQLLHSDTELRPVSLQPLVDNVINDCTREFDYEADVRTEIPSGLTALGNEKLRYVIDNLVDNALRHNPADTSVMIAAREYGVDKVELVITDDGGGLPTVEKQIVSGHTDIDQLNHGSGLGLWLVRWVLDTHYATAEVETQNQQGTTFKIYLHQ
jgi:anti-sigma regulatory factor (Ser/Thr protein kinase)